MDNMELYNKFKTVPPEAQKKIDGGRLRGFTDINPMWRLKVLTEVFGPVGVGWYYEIKRSWAESGAKDETAVFVEVHLFYKSGDEWSRPIPGVGGNTLVELERNGLRTNDECYKMALTDALSVACKALGIGADIYYEKDRSKYDKPDDQAPPAGSAPPPPVGGNAAQGNATQGNATQGNATQGNGAQGNTAQGNSGGKPLSEAQCRRYYAIAKNAGFEKEDADGLVLKRYRKDDVSKLSKAEYDKLCTGLEQNPEITMEWYLRSNQPA